MFVLSLQRFSVHLLYFPFIFPFFSIYFLVIFPLFFSIYFLSWFTLWNFSGNWHIFYWTRRFLQPSCDYIHAHAYAPVCMCSHTRARAHTRTKPYTWWLTSTHVWHFGLNYSTFYNCFDYIWLLLYSKMGIKFFLFAASIFLLSLIPQLSVWQCLLALSWK